MTYWWQIQFSKGCTFAYPVSLAWNLLIWSNLTFMCLSFSGFQVKPGLHVDTRGNTDNRNIKFWTHLVFQLAACFLAAWLWPQAGGICELCPSPKQDRPWPGRLDRRWESPGLSFALCYQSEPPNWPGLSACRQGCTYERELHPYCRPSAWTEENRSLYGQDRDRPQGWRERQKDESS